MAKKPRKNKLRGRHGGRREGAGRKPKYDGGATKISVSIASELACRLENHVTKLAGTRSEVVGRAVLHYLNGIARGRIKPCISGSDSKKTKGC